MKYHTASLLTIFSIMLTLLVATELRSQPTNLFDPFLKNVEGISISTERTFKYDNPGEDHDVFLRKYSVSLKYKKIEFGGVVGIDSTSKLIHTDSVFNFGDGKCSTYIRSYEKQKQKKKALSLTPVFGYSYDSRLTKTLSNATISLPNDGLFVKGIITLNDTDSFWRHFLLGVTLSLFNIRDNIGNYSNADSNRTGIFKASSSLNLTGEIFTGVSTEKSLSGVVLFLDAGWRFAEIRNITYSTLDDKKVSNSELNDKLPHAFDFGGLFVRLGLSIDISPG